jgi:hypothetical protein
MGRGVGLVAERRGSRLKKLRSLSHENGSLMGVEMCDLTIISGSLSWEDPRAVRVSIRFFSTGLYRNTKELPYMKEEEKGGKLKLWSGPYCCPKSKF